MVVVVMSTVGHWQWPEWANGLKFECQSWPGRCSALTTGSPAMTPRVLAPLGQSRYSEAMKLNWMEASAPPASQATGIASSRSRTVGISSDIKYRQG